MQQKLESTQVKLFRAAKMNSLRAIVGKQKREQLILDVLY